MIFINTVLDKEMIRLNTLNLCRAQDKFGIGYECHVLCWNIMQE